MKLHLLLFFQLFFFVLLTSGNHVLSQAYITGRVADSRTGDPLAFAGLKYGTKTSVADLNGNFVLVNESDSLNLIISYIGYKSVSLNIFTGTDRIDLGTILMSEESNMINEITITSGKLRKSIEEVTVSMESLKPEFLEKNNTVRFDNILEKIPGVSFIDGQVNIRGGSGFTYGAGSRVLILYDNIPALQFDSAFPNWSNIPVESISKVEVMKGAGSALYGSSAMNGVINILSRTAKMKPYAKFKAFATVYDSPADTAKKWWGSQLNPYKYGLSGEFAQKIGNLDIVTSLYYMRDPKNFKKDCESYIGRFTLKLDYQLTEAFSFGIHSNLNAENRTTFYYWENSGKGAYIGDKNSYSNEIIKVFVIDPHIKYLTRNGGKHTLQSRIYYVTTFLTEDKSNDSYNTFFEYQYQKNFSDLDLVVTSGLVNSLGITDARHYGDTIFLASNNAFYLQAEKKLWNKITFEFGSRYEINSVKGPKIIDGKNISDKYKRESKPVFRTGMNFGPFKMTNIRMSWGQGFRYPAIAEKFTNALSGSVLILPNPELKSESGYSGEAGIRQGFKTKSIYGFFDFSVFQSEYNDMIEFLLVFNKRLYFTAQNVGNTIISGCELTSGLNYNFGEFKLDFTGGYMYLDPKYKNFENVKHTVSNDSVNILKYRYKHTYRFDLDLNYKKFNFGIGASYNSFMPSVDRLLEQPVIVKGVAEYRKKNNKGAHVFRARAGLKMSNFDIVFNVDNLFNTEYSVRPALIEAPRSFTLSIAYSIN